MKLQEKTTKYYTQKNPNNKNYSDSVANKTLAHETRWAYSPDPKHQCRPNWAV